MMLVSFTDLLHPYCVTNTVRNIKAVKRLWWRSLIIVSKFHWSFWSFEPCKGYGAEQRSNFMEFWQILICTGGGYSYYFLTECAARGSKPLPIFKDFSHSKNGWLDSFRNFCKLRPISKGFLSQKRLILQFVRNFCKMGPSSMIFLTIVGPYLRIFGEKVSHLGGTSPYALTCEYPPGFARFRFIGKSEFEKVY